MSRPFRHSTALATWAPQCLRESIDYMKRVRAGGRACHWVLLGMVILLITLGVVFWRCARDHSVTGHTQPGHRGADEFARNHPFKLVMAHDRGDA